MKFSKLAFAALFGVLVACVASSPAQEDGTDQTAPATAVTLDDLQGSASPLLGCGFTCTTNGIVGLPWKICMNNCPGGAENCVPTPAPCP